MFYYGTVAESSSKIFKKEKSLLEGGAAALAQKSNCQMTICQKTGICTFLYRHLLLIDKEALRVVKYQAACTIKLFTDVIFAVS
jgi:hypothetical protein